MTVQEVFDAMSYGPAPESAEPAHAWLARHGHSFGHFIGGAFSQPGLTFETVNPANGQLLARVAQGEASDVDAAVKAARQALPLWQGLSPEARARYLYAIARQLQKHARLFAVLESLDNGKPLRESRDIDVPLAIRHFYHHAGWAALVESEFAGYVPVGVCGQIIPWNFPLLMLAWKVAPALAAGNTVVLKPAEYTPLSALLFAELTQAVGLPAGVFNLVTGDGETGAALVAHPEVDKVAFTGSTEVGRLIRERTAGSGKKLSLELGGKSPFIVFEDADLDAAVEGVVDAIWFNQGQVCCAGSRLLAQEGIAGKLFDKLKRRMATLRLGDPLDKGIDIGAVVAPAQLERIRKLVAQGVREGAVCYQPELALPERGCFYPPTLLTEVAPASTVAQEEIFGPVLAAMTFRTQAEAVELANNSRYGLAASVWSENINVALAVAAQLKAGVVWINSTNQFDAASGFGGYRESGFGREGGREGMYEYLVPRWQKLLKPRQRQPFTPAPLAGTPADGIDRTAKLYIGGKQLRPDSGYSYAIVNAAGERAGELPLGNRKDLRNAVEAARKASGWSAMSGHSRAQVLYYVAENLSARADEFGARLRQLTGVSRKAAQLEVDASLARILYYAAQADKYDGAIHSVPGRQLALAVHEPWGVLAISCPDEAPLLSFISLVMPAVAVGNRVVATPSSRYGLIITDLYQVFDTSDLPGGVINIVTGVQDELAKTLAEHDGVAAMWYVGSAEGVAMVERASAGNLKALWASSNARDWFDPEQGQGREYLRQALQVKNIWVPYGD